MDVKGNLTFNPLDKRLYDFPYPVLQQLRSTDPVFFESSLGAYVITGYNEVAAATKHPQGDFKFIETQKARLGMDAESQPFVKAMREWVLMKNGEDHRRVRASFQRFFAPQSVVALRSQMIETAHELLDSMGAEGGNGDFMKLFALPLPLVVISRMLKVPDEDQPKIEHMIEGFKVAVGYLPMNPEQLATANQGLSGMEEYFGKLIEERRRNLGDDVLSAMIAEADAGALTAAELIANVWGMYAAGHETTASAICNGMLLFLNNPEQLQLLRSDWSLLKNAVEEVVRMDGPGQATTRTLPVDFQVGNHLIPAHTPMVIFYPGANHDPAKFADPDVFDIKRERVREHLGFGSGPHRCAGQILAQATLAIAFESVFKRMEGLRVAGDFEWNQLQIFRAPQTLPLAWDVIKPRSAD